MQWRDLPEIDGRCFWLLRDLPGRRGSHSFASRHFEAQETSFWSWTPVSAQDSVIYGVRTPAVEQAVVELETTPERSLAPTFAPVTLVAIMQKAVEPVVVVDVITAMVP